ncbi:hypothetical protein H6F89_34315 [Cyanobacteria bacterium FACHB-63]|nr:hypothetical protein [Cyanobacteria bacterium FACHB-63]
MLEASFFSPSKDSDADSYETQREDFREVAQERAIQALFSEAEALKARIEMVIDRHLRWVVPNNMKIEVRVFPRSPDDNTGNSNGSVEVQFNSDPASVKIR